MTKEELIKRLSEFDDDSNIVLKCDPDTKYPEIDLVRWNIDLQAIELISNEDEICF